MNPQVQELAAQCGMESDVLDENEGIIWWLGNSDLEKFAELIVREVFAKIEDERFEVYQPVKESVMKHFGVEE